MANLVELFDNIVQMQALNGVPLTRPTVFEVAIS